MKWLLTLWCLFLLIQTQLSGYVWTFNLLDSMPPVGFVFLPLFFAAINLLWSANRWLFFYLWLALAVVGFPRSDINLGAFVACEDCSQSDKTISILNWNTQYWANNAGSDDLVSFIECAKTDVVTLQENHQLPNGVTTHREWQQIAGLPDLFVITKGELVTLSRYPIVGHNKDDTSSMFLRTDIALDENRIVSIYNIHLPVHVSLSLNPLSKSFFEFVRSRHARRQFELENLATNIQNNRNGSIVAGDFNSTVAMRKFSHFKSSLCDSASRSDKLIPATFGVSGIELWRPDYVLTTPGIEITSHERIRPGNMSDHLALKVEFNIDELLPTDVPRARDSHKACI